MTNQKFGDFLIPPLPSAMLQCLKPYAFLSQKERLPPPPLCVTSFMNGPQCLFVFLLIICIFCCFQFTMETMDRRGALLTFRCTLIQVDLKILVDFRLSRGCGLEFKKHFAKIKANCAGIIETGPIMWPTLIASNAIPGVPNQDRKTTFVHSRLSLFYFHFLR